MKQLLFVALIVATLLGWSSGAELRGGARAAAEQGAGQRVGDDDAGSGGDEGGGGGGTRGPAKRPDWLQPVLPQTVPVPKEPSDEKAIRLIQQMKKPWEGMEDPRLDQTEEGLKQAMERHAKRNGESKPITNAGADGNEADAPPPKAKRRPVVPLLPPVHPQRTLLWNPADVLAPRWTPVADEWDKHAEQKEVEAMPFHPLRLFSKRVSPMWAADVRKMHNERYVKRHQRSKKYIPPNMRLNPPFFPHVVARYTDRVPSTDLNANPIEWPVARRYIGERRHGPYDLYHENPDRYQAPLDLFSWRKQKKARLNAIWPHKIHFPQLPPPTDTWNQMIQLNERVQPYERHLPRSQQSDAEEDSAADAESDGDADADLEADAALLEVDTEMEAGAEAGAEEQLTPKEMYWYWVQPEKGRDRYGRDGRLFTPRDRRHYMHKYLTAADAALGYSTLHVAPGPKPAEQYVGLAHDMETGIKPVKTQVQAEPFDATASLNIADLQRKLEVNKENGGKAAEAMLNDDRMPYLFTDGKPDEADYKQTAGPSADNKYTAEAKANAKKAASILSPWKMGAEGDLADHPNFPYASFRRSWLGEPRGFRVPMLPPSLVYQHIKAGSKADFPVSYGGEQKEKPAASKPAGSSLLELDDEDEDEEGEQEEAEAEEAEEEGEEDAAFIQLDEMHARAHIPSSLHDDPPLASYHAPPSPIRLDANGNPIAHPAPHHDEEEEEEEEQQDAGAEEEADNELAAVETAAHAASASASSGAANDESGVPLAMRKPWWETRAGRLRNAMSAEQRRVMDQRKADTAQVLDQSLFHAAYSAPVSSDSEGESEADKPRGSAAALLDSLAAIAHNPLSDAANVFAGQPKSAADRAMADVGRDQAMRFAGVDEEERAGPELNAETMDVGAGPSAGGMRFREVTAGAEGEELTSKPAKSESAATFAADPNSFERTLSNIEHADVSGEAIGEGPAAGEAIGGETMRFAGPPPPTKDAQSGYGVGLRGMILTQDAAIIAGPNRYRSPTLVNPYSIAMARAQQPYGPAGPYVPNGGSPFANYPYNYPYGVPVSTVPAVAVPGSASTAFGPRGLKAGGGAAKDAPTTVVNIFGASGAVSSTPGATAAAAAASATKAVPLDAAYPYPYPVAGGPLPYGDTFPPSNGPFPPPLSGLMDIAASMHGRMAPGSAGHPPPALYGHPFQKVPVPQFPPSSPTVPYPRYPMGPVGALAESGWQKPRLIPIVYGGKV